MQTKNYSTFGVGLDRLFDEISRISIDGKPNYPPYNIIQLDDYLYRIELAVAGFSEKELDIEFADDVLKISGKTERNDDHYAFLHRGISGRTFERKFILNPDVKIGNVKLEHGILSIELERVVPEHKKPRKIEIGSSNVLEHKPEKELLLEDEKVPDDTGLKVA